MQTFRGCTKAPPVSPRGELQRRVAERTAELEAASTQPAAQDETRRTGAEVTVAVHGSGTGVPAANLRMSSTA